MKSLSSRDIANIFHTVPPGQVTRSGHKFAPFAENSFVQYRLRPDVFAPSISMAVISSFDSENPKALNDLRMRVRRAEVVTTPFPPCNCQRWST